jgi:hypothetical protein
LSPREFIIVAGQILPNLACLDYSAAHSGPMVAYRWDGETVITKEKFTL